MIDDFDILIGATSVAHNMIMVTNNVAHLSRLDNIIIERLDCAGEEIALTQQGICNSRERRNNQGHIAHTINSNILSLFNHFKNLPRQLPSILILLHFNY